MKIRENHDSENRQNMSETQNLPQSDIAREQEILENSRLITRRYDESFPSMKVFPFRRAENQFIKDMSRRSVML